MTWAAIVAIVGAVVSILAAVAAARSASHARAVSVLGGRRERWTTYLQALIAWRETRRRTSRRREQLPAAQSLHGDSELDRLGEAYHDALIHLRQVAPTVPGLPRTSAAHVGGRLDAAQADGLIREAEDELDRIDGKLEALSRLWRLSPPT